MWKPRMIGWRLFLVCGLGFLLHNASVEASDWPHFRGLTGAGVSTEEGLTRSWGEQGPREVWREAIGNGFSGMAIVGQRIYTTEILEGEQRAVALHAATGERLWSTGFGTDYQDPNGFGNGARSTPTVDGDMVYAVSADSVLLALAADTGELRWRSDFKKDFGAAAPRFGYGTSPFILRDLLVIETGGPEGKSIVAFDKLTGEVRWSSQDEPASYATPIVLTLGGREQLVFNRRSGLVGLASDTGEKLWQHPSAPDSIAMPIFVAPDKLFISSAAMGDGGHMIRVLHGEEGFSTEVVWSNSRFRNHFNNSVAVEGYLYGFDNATFRCLDLETGESRWAYRGFGKGSLVAADGLLFVLSDKGLLALVEATPEDFRELGRVQAMEGRSWTSPSLAGGRLYVRDHDEIVAYDVRGADKFEMVAQPESDGGSEAGSSRDLPETAVELVRRYIEARGGRERWARLKSLEITGRYSAFSHEADFVELHKRTADGDLFRLEFENLGGRATWARDEKGLWWVFPLLEVSEPARLDQPPAASYIAQLERRAELEPALLHWQERGLEVTLTGVGKVGDKETLDLEVKFAEDQVETWHLDPETWLEVAIESMIVDYSQMAEPMTQRVFFSDFRDVDGLVLPHRLALEFGARLEEIQVDEVKLDATIASDRFAFPEAVEKEAKEPGGNEN